MQDRDTVPVRTPAAAPQSRAESLPAPADDGPAVRVWSLSTTILVVMATLAIIFVARALLLPITFAVFLKIAFTPAVRMLRRMGVPLLVGGALIVGGIVVVLAAAGYLLTPPAIEWSQELPAALARIEGEIVAVKRPISGASAISDQLEEMTETGSSRPLRVEVSESSGLNQILVGAGSFGLTLASTLILMLFLLASDEALLRSVVEISPRLRDKKVAVESFRGIERRISRYLLTTGVINGILGVCAGLAFWALGVPNPILWGAMAAFLNFIPYLGPAVGIAVMAAVGIMTFDSLGAALAAPGAYFVINFIEGMIVTPAALGRTMTLSPVAIFVSIMLWSWMWGVGGAVLAVPILVAVTIVLETIPSLLPLSSLLGSGRSARPASQPIPS